MQPSVAASFRRWAKLERRALPPPSALLSRMRSSALQRRVLRSAASRLLVCTLKCRPQSPSARSSEPPSHAPLSDKPEPRTGILLRLPSPAPLETAASSMHSVPPAIASNTRRPPAEISGGMVPLSDRNNAAHELDSSLIITHRRMVSSSLRPRCHARSEASSMYGVHNAALLWAVCAAGMSGVLRTQVPV